MELFLSTGLPELVSMDLLGLVREAAQRNGFVLVSTDRLTKT